MELLTPPTTPRGSFEPLRKAAFYPTPSHITNLPLTPPITPVLESSERLPSLFEEPVTDAQYQSRQLTDNELSYFLPSRADGVNDMYVHHRLSADPALLSHTRVLYIWAYQLLRHPLLASSILANDYEDVHFVRAVPRTVDEALQQATNRFHLLTSSPHHSIVDAYLNGPRTLSPERLSCLVLATPSLPAYGLLTPPPSPSSDNAASEYEFMLCATHSIGDGMALHTFMNEFYTILGSAKSTSDIYTMISDTLHLDTPSFIPRGLEERFSASTSSSSLKSAAETVDYHLNQSRLTGNQSFPLVPYTQRQTRRSVVPTFAYSPEETKRILGSCKANGVTIAHAVFALCNIAWARKVSSSQDACIMYSAANLRPQMAPGPAESFFHLAIGYFNISLPCLHVPIPTSDLMWHRARSVKSQTIKATRSTFLTSRSRREGVERRERAVKWAKMDDGVHDATPVRPVLALISQSASAPQKALMGVSMLGNLDGMYKHANFPALKLHSLMTGSRQRSAGLLLFAYTFQGQLWLSLGYDMNGFAPGVIEGFWEGVQDLVSEVMLA